MLSHGMPNLPSRHSTCEQAAQLKSVTTRSGGLRFDVHDKLGALVQLVKVLGLTMPGAAPGSTTINNTPVSVAGDVPALQVARRRAFALERAAQASQLDQTR